jgi:type II secretory pathway pseudopilin PulG
VRRAFTLMEVLVGAIICAVVLSAAAAVFGQAIAGRERVREAGRRAQELTRAYETISRDLHSATLPPDDTGLQFGLSQAQSGAAGQAGESLQIASVVGEPLLAGRQANETVLVQYALAPDPKTDEPTLWRYETPYPLPSGDTTPTGGVSSETRQLRLLHGVVQIAFLFYDAAQQTWVDTWDGQAGLPPAIRMDLSFGEKDAQEETHHESWIFNLPPARYTNDQAAAAQ